MSGKNKLPKWEVTQSKKLKNYSSYKEICPPWIKDSPCYYLVMVDFIFFNAANNKGMGNVFFFCYQKPNKQKTTGDLFGNTIYRRLQMPKLVPCKINFSGLPL